jgi:transcriptional regulator with XRE-family HTH domain
MQVNADRIRQARVDARLTQDELARKLETSQRNIVRWEKGENQPRIEKLGAIAEATGHEVGYFLSSEDEDEEAADPVASLMDAIRAIVRQEVRV